MSKKNQHINNTNTPASLTNPKHHDSNTPLNHAKFDAHGLDNYSFTFSTDLASVQSLSQVNGTSTRALDMTGSTFSTTVGLNDKNNQSVLSVVQKLSDNNVASTRIYGDSDGDGQYVKNFDIQVAKIADTHAHQQKFTLNTDGTVTAPATINQDHHTKPFGQNVVDQLTVLNKTTLNNVIYVTKTQADSTSGEYHFEIFRDDNNDGNWTEIAHGETLANNIDTTTGAINLVGIQSYLADASSIIG